VIQIHPEKVGSFDNLWYKHYFPSKGRENITHYYDTDKLRTLKVYVLHVLHNGIIEWPMALWNVAGVLTIRGLLYFL
jgi:hypothetical protein